MSSKYVLAAARFHIPQTDRLVNASAGNDLAVGRKRHRPDGTAANKSLKKIVLTPSIFLYKDFCRYQ
jgi:hypothetical protein